MASISDIADNQLNARLSSGDVVTVNLYGANVTSWKLSDGREQLFLSESASLDGSKDISGGIPLVFPVFGQPPKEGHGTSNLPYHGFAKNSFWRFLGNSQSEDLTASWVKLNFGLDSGTLTKDIRSKWPYKFDLVYSVKLTFGKLETNMSIINNGKESFEFMCLFHSYFRIKNILNTSISGLKSSQYVDKVRQAHVFTDESPSLALTSETDRIYTPLNSIPLVIYEDEMPRFTITRNVVPDVTVWNPWEEKATLMGKMDFGPKHEWKQMICVEPGSVRNWTKLEAGDTWNGGQIIEAHH